MFLQSSYTTEYLSETNLVLTQEDYGNKLTDFLQPIKHYLTDDQDLLAFSLARYCGANTHLAFYLQWLLMTTLLTVDTTELQIKTREYLLKKRAASLTDLENVGTMVNKMADTVYLPFQMNLIQSKSYSMVADLIHKHTYLHKYLSRTFYGKILANEMRCRSFWLQENLTVQEYVGMQGLRESYMYVGYPILVSLAYNFNQTESVVNPSAIKWVFLEEVLEIISSLHQTGRGFELERMYYYETLDASGKVEWLSLSLTEQKKVLLHNDQIQQKGKEFRLSQHRKGLNTLENLRLPDQYKEMLVDLLEWAFASNFVEE